MKETINAYRDIVVTPEFRELARLRDRARHNEASAIHNAIRIAREEWDAENAEKEEEWQSRIASLEAEIAKYKGS